ncbi:MAG: T9SS type A sorting domain-containing protein [Cytophagales bacterium]|nr:T9SS type A sorting domain-containing protein [Cytophagales bacterium]
MEIPLVAGQDNNAEVLALVTESGILVERIDALTQVETLSQNLLLIWPNPSSGQVFSAQTGTAIIRNLSGSLVYKGPLGTEGIDLSQQPKGLYLVELIHESGAELFTQKLILK